MNIFNSFNELAASQTGSCSQSNQSIWNEPRATLGDIGIDFRFEHYAERLPNVDKEKQLEIHRKFQGIDMTKENKHVKPKIIYAVIPDELKAFLKENGHEGNVLTSDGHTFELHQSLPFNAETHVQLPDKWVRAAKITKGNQRIKINDE